MITRCVSLFSLFFLFCSIGVSQEETKEAISKLVGAKEKTWIFTRIEKYMGSDKCKSGESWTFFQDGRVVVKKCENGEIKSEEKRWSIEKKSPIDVAVKISDVEYLLLFPPPKRGSTRQSMILRLKADSKVSATKDLIFYYEVD